MSELTSKTTYVDPKVDIAFKKIFGDENKTHILISFMNAVMEKDIVKVEIRNPYQVPKLEELKYTVLDIKATDSKGNEYIVEMQTSSQKAFEKRAVDYVARAYAFQLVPGENYEEHQPVYFIGILNFNHFNSEDYLSKHCTINLETGEQEIKEFEYYFIELKKFKKELSDLTDVKDKWTYFIKKLHSMESLPKELAEIKAISDAAETAKQSLWTREEMDAYYQIQREEAARMKQQKDHEEMREKVREMTGKVREMTGKVKKMTGKVKEMEKKVQEAEEIKKEARKIKKETQEMKKEVQEKEEALTVFRMAISGKDTSEISNLLGIDEFKIKKILAADK